MPSTNVRKKSSLVKTAEEVCGGVPVATLIYGSYSQALLVPNPVIRWQGLTT